MFVSSFSYSAFKVSFKKGRQLLKIVQFQSRSLSGLRFGAGPRVEQSAAGASRASPPPGGRSGAGCCCCRWSRRSSLWRCSRRRICYTRITHHRKRAGHRCPTTVPCLRLSAKALSTPRIEHESASGVAHRPQRTTPGGIVRWTCFWYAFTRTNITTGAIYINSLYIAQLGWI